jgi:hypothetical protein
MGNIREHDVDGIRVKVDLEAEDTLAVRLQSLHVEGPAPAQPARQILERQARTITDEVTYLDGPLGVVEVDGVSNAVQIRTKKPDAGRFVEVVLRGGNSIDLDARGGAVHVARENYDRLVDTLTGLVR